MVGTDNPNAAFCGLPSEPTTDDDMRLDVHHVGLELVEDARRVSLTAPRENDSQPVVRVPTQGADAVHDELGALVAL